MTDFDYDVLQKKRIAYQAKHKKCGSKSKKCPMSTDYMTQKQWQERCGEVYTYNMNEPKSWETFKKFPIDIQKEYISYLVKNYNVNATSLAEMFGVKPPAVRRYIEIKQLGFTFKTGDRMNAGQKAAWQRFLGKADVAEEDAQYIAQPLSVPAANEDTEEPDTVLPEEISFPKTIHTNGMDMKQFSLTFQGKIDVGMIANSILSIVGKDAVGTIEVKCNLELPL